MPTKRPSEAGRPWWRRRGPSFWVLALLMAILVAGTAILTTMVGSVLPKVPQDKAGLDPWEDPLAVMEHSSGFTIASIPDCAAGLVTRIVLWDENSNPYWEVSGPPTRLSSFILGATPDAFTSEVDYEAPPKNADVRLVVFRRVGSPVGLRFKFSDLTEDRLMGGVPLTSYSEDGWKKAAVCGSGADTKTLATDAAG